MLLYAISLLSCQKPSVVSGATNPVTAGSIAPGLTLYLTDAADVPQTGLNVSWRPVFAEPDSALGGSALTDNQGRLLVSSLLPGVRYLFSTVFSDSTVQQWYRAPSLTGALMADAETADAYTTDADSWQWVLHKDRLQEDSPHHNSEPLKPQRLHYLLGAAPTFKSALAVAAEEMQTLPLNLSDLRPLSDLVWWVSGDFEADPGLLTAAAVEALEAFVFKGGRLVINGEWAGMQSVLRQPTQALGRRLGVMVSQDSLAQTESTLTIENIHRHWLTDGVQTLVLSRSGSVRVYNPKTARELAFAGAEHYRIAGLSEQHTVLATVAYGQGTIIAVGDSSLWSEGLFYEKDNRRLWENILNFSKEASEDASVKQP